MAAACPACGCPELEVDTSQALAYCPACGAAQEAESLEALPGGTFVGSYDDGGGAGLCLSVPDVAAKA